MIRQQNYRYRILLLIAISASVRAVLSACVELGNDEAYYYTYALYPDLSHFDHPPMVGWLIRFFSINLLFTGEFFIRLSSVVLGSLNTWLIYLIGKELKDEKTGWLAALLYVTSIYAFVITGIMILPDTPQNFFWLLSLYFMIRSLPVPEQKYSARWLVLASVSAGFALLSKYTSIFLLLGMLTYAALYRREWFSKPVFYLAGLIPVLMFTPVILWNFQHHFVSFGFHSARIEPAADLINMDSFLTELAGEWLYTNPFNWFILLFSLIAFMRKKIYNKGKMALLVVTGLPLVIVFIAASLFRPTLPHWNGPGYVTLMPVAACWLAETGRKATPGILWASCIFLLGVVGTAVVQIKTGLLPVDKLYNKEAGTGAHDYSLELYGWKQLRTAFAETANRYESEGSMKAYSPIVTYRWFPAGNFEYYLTKGTSRPVLATGDTNAIHKYAWINALHGGFKLNSDAWYITSSRDFRQPAEMKSVYYHQILGPDTIAIRRCDKTAYYFFIYRLKNLQGKR